MKSLNADSIDFVDEFLRIFVCVYGVWCTNRFNKNLVIIIEQHGTFMAKRHVSSLLM